MCIIEGMFRKEKNYFLNKIKIILIIQKMIMKKSVKSKKRCIFIYL